MKIVGRKTTDFSNAFAFSVSSRPSPPNVITPVNVCYGAKDYILQANGQNLKWYEGENAKDFTYSILVNTNSANKQVYYVSQSDANQCESQKSRIEVMVDEPVSGEIRGNSNIYLGDSAFINISLKGSAPWLLAIDPIGELNINTPEFKIAVSPHLSTAYKLSKVSNFCGIGTAKGEAKINVLSILGNAEPNNSELRVFPNPIYDQTVHFEITGSDVSEIELYSSEGKHIKTYKPIEKSNGELTLPPLSFGRYNLKFISSKKTYTISILK
jgi:Ig-like domain CHU_C associated